MQRVVERISLLARYYFGKDSLTPWNGEGPIPYSHSEPLLQMLTDGTFSFTNYWTTLQLSEAGAPVYLFELEHVPSFTYVGQT